MKSPAIFFFLENISHENQHTCAQNHTTSTKKPFKKEKTEEICFSYLPQEVSIMNYPINGADKGHNFQSVPTQNYELLQQHANQNLN